MDTYEFFVTLHVISAIAWVGGSTYLAIAGRRAIGRGDKGSIGAFLSDTAWSGPHFFIPISISTILFGILGVIKGPWEFSDPWVSAALGIFVLSFIIGASFLGPQTEKTSEEVAATGLDGPGIMDRIRRIQLVHDFDLLLLYSVVIIMVTKPS